MSCWAAGEFGALCPEFHSWKGWPAGPCCTAFALMVQSRLVPQVAPQIGCPTLLCRGTSGCTSASPLQAVG